MSDLQEKAMLSALQTLEAWNNYDLWIWPVSALEQAKRNTVESLQLLSHALEEKEQTVSVKDAVLAERKACIKICEDMAKQFSTALNETPILFCIQAIRARGEE